MGRVQDPSAEPADQRSWLVPALYAALIAGNLLVAYDWWRRTPQGQATLERAGAWVRDLRTKAAECEGCAKRKAWLREHLTAAAAESAVMEAESIVRGDA